MLRRFFHSSRAQGFKQKAAATQKKTRVPQLGKDVEHRNFRQATAYSNFQGSAPEVAGLRVLGGELETGMFTYPDAVQASLVHSGSFPPQQHNELFRTHTSLFRDQTIAEAQTLEGSRKLLLGPSGVGKSTLLSQLQAKAKLEDWVVIHLPRAYETIDGSTDHVLSGHSYLQPMFVKRWFEKICKANRNLEGDALQLAKSGDPAALLEFVPQLNRQGIKVLLSVDGINAWSHQPYALNRNKENEQIYHGDLQVPRMILEYLSGARPIEGAVVAATTARYSTNATIEAALGRREAPAFAPITEFDPVLSSHLEGVEPVDVSYMSADEARVWIEYLHAAGVAPEATEQFANERFAAAGGNPSYLLRSFITYSF